jgi:hypothetical protein
MASCVLASGSCVQPPDRNAHFSLKTEARDGDRMSLVSGGNV